MLTPLLVRVLQTLSPALREFMGGGAQTARYQDVVTHLWAHVRQHNLQVRAQWA